MSVNIKSMSSESVLEGQPFESDGVTMLLNTRYTCCIIQRVSLESTAGYNQETSVYQHSGMATRI